MKKVNFKKKFVPLLIIAVVVTSIFVYSKSSLAEFKTKQTDVSVELNVEKIDKDTVKVSLDNFTPLVKSLQLGIKIDGDVKFTEDNINWLVSSDDENLKTNVKMSSDNQSMEIFIVSTEALKKEGGKLDIFEVDLNKTDGESSKYRIIPSINDDGIAYSYVLNDTNKQVSGVDIANLDESYLTLNSAPKLELSNHTSIVEGKIVISKDSSFEPLDYVIATDDEDGDIDKSNITVTNNEVKVDAVGSYNISYSVEDSDGEITTLDATVIVEENQTEDIEKPVITVTNKVITTEYGVEVDLLDGVKAVDYLDRELTVSVSGYYDFNTVGTYTITYSAIDRYGNEADEVTATLIVEASKPVITVTNSIITINEGDTVNLLDGVNAVDYLGNELQVEVSGDYDFNKSGTYTIRYNATDSLGNKADEVTATLIVEEVKSEDSETPSEPGDSEDSNNPGNSDTPSNPDDSEIPSNPDDSEDSNTPSEPGDSEDSNNPGNSNTPSNPDDSDDQEQPEISLPEDIIKVEGNGTEESPIIYKTENIVSLKELVDQVQDEFKAVVINRIILNDETQEYHIRLDSKGIIARLLRRTNSYYIVLRVPNTDEVNAIFATLDKEDTEAPVIEYNGALDITVENGSSFEIPEVTAKDNLDVDLTVEVVIKDNNGEVIENIDTTKAGKYTITYTVEDESGNKSIELIVTVTVTEANVNSENTGDSNNQESSESQEGSGNQEVESTTNTSDNGQSTKEDLPTTGQGIYFGATILIGIALIGSGAFAFAKKKK